jgi:radical SAM protein with 4Fe4S-binding SPASM domain
MPGAWRKTVSSIEACQENGLAVQIHTTATRANHTNIQEMISFAAEHNAVAFHLYFLVCTGRGQQMIDITPAEYSVALSTLVDAHEKYQGQMLIRARCAPHFRRLAYSQSAEFAASSAGCMAGISYCRITPEGEITPCPYLPISVGSLRKDSLAHIWETAQIFNQLQQPVLTGRCGVCEFGALCGGCRARAYAVNDDIMAEDPWCDYQPGEIGNILLKTISSLEWTTEALTRLERVPPVLRPMVEKGVEAYARSKDLMIITPELMAEMRAKSARMGSFRRSGFPDRHPAKNVE